MSFGLPQSDVYVGASAVLLTHGGTKRQMECGWVRWPQRSRSGPHTIDRSGSSPCASSHNRGRGTELWETVRKGQTRDSVPATWRWLHKSSGAVGTAPRWNLELGAEPESGTERQAAKGWEYCCLRWGLLVDLLRAHPHRLEEGYGGDCGERELRPWLGRKVRTSS